MSTQNLLSGRSEAETLQPILAAAQAAFEAIVEVEQAISRDYDRLFRGAWLLGQALVPLKAAIGHGRWLFWLGQNWDALGEDKARRCIAFGLVVFFDRSLHCPDQPIQMTFQRRRAIEMPRSTKRPA